MLLNEEMNWKAKIDALDTAINIYVTRGFLHSSNNVLIPSGGPLCTTDYDVPAASLDADWERISSHILMVTMNMKADFFANGTDSGDLLTTELDIGNDQSFYLRFDGTHRMWYTLEKPDQIITSKVQSDPLYENQVCRFLHETHDFDDVIGKQHKYLLQWQF